MKPIVLLLAAGSAVSALLLVSCGGASPDQLEAAHKEVLSFSNKWDQAKSLAADLQRAVQSAQTNVALTAGHMLALSNRIAGLKSELAEAQGHLQSTAATVQAREARIAELEAALADSGKTLEQARQETARVSAHLDEARKKIFDVEQQRLAAFNEREVLRAKIIELLQKLNDPDQLRAQLKRVKSGTALRPAPLAEPQETTSTPRESAAVPADPNEPVATQPPDRVPAKASGL